MTPPGAWVLAVDFGTTNTVAAVADATGTRTLTIDGRPVMASAVLLVDHRVTRDSWMVGDAAVRFARRKLEWFDPSPKRSIADRTLFLGGRDVPVTEAIAALLAPIVKEAASQHGGRPPTSFVVTHPATWADSRVRVLTDGAAAVTAGMRGWPAPRPMTEPEAAAQAPAAWTQDPVDAPAGCRRDVGVPLEPILHPIDPARPASAARELTTRGIG